MNDFTKLLCKSSTILAWWATDPQDPRSRVTLRHLLSFTSGYYADGLASPLCSVGVAAPEQYMACAISLYNHSHSYGAEPGSTWAYLTCHLVKCDFWHTTLEIYRHAKHAK